MHGLGNFLKKFLDYQMKWQMKILAKIYQEKCLKINKDKQSEKFYVILFLLDNRNNIGLA